MHLMQRVWVEDDGVLSFEWVLLVTLLTIGIVSGLAAARDAIIDELGDVAQAMLALDQSYTICFPLEIIVHAPDCGAASDSAAFSSIRIWTAVLICWSSTGISTIPGAMSNTPRRRTCS